MARLRPARRPVCFLRDRLHHIRADSHQGRGAMGSALLAFGAECAVAVASADLGWCVETANVPAYQLIARGAR